MLYTWSCILTDRDIDAVIETEDTLMFFKHKYIDQGEIMHPLYGVKKVEFCLGKRDENWDDTCIL